MSSQNSCSLNSNHIHFNSINLLSFHVEAFLHNIPPSKSKCKVQIPKYKFQNRIPKFQIPNSKLQIPSVHRLVPMCGGPTAQMVVRRRGAAHSCYPEPAPLQPGALISLWNVGFLDGIRISRCLFWIFDLLVNPHLGSEARIISNQIAKLSFNSWIWENRLSVIILIK